MQDTNQPISKGVKPLHKTSEVDKVEGRSCSLKLHDVSAEIYSKGSTAKAEMAKVNVTEVIHSCVS